MLTEVDLLEHKRALMQDPEFRPGMKELSDVRKVERLDITSEGVKKLVALDVDHALGLGEYRLAIVVSADIVFGMARMYEILTESHDENVRVFRAIDEAKAWLGIDPGDD